MCWSVCLFITTLFASIELNKQSIFISLDISAVIIHLFLVAGLVLLISYFNDLYSLGAVKAGYCTAACVFAGSLVRPIGGMVADRIGGVRTLLTMYSIAAVLLVIMSFGQPTYQLALAIIIPVMAPKFKFPKLPPELEFLRDLQGVPVSDDFFEAMIDRLIRLMSNSPRR